MRSVKRVAALLFALAMVVALNASALAENSTVYAKRVPYLTAQFTWGDMYFTYNEEDKSWKVSDADTVDEGGVAQPVTHSNTVTIKNLSEQDSVKVTYAFSATGNLVDAGGLFFAPSGMTNFTLLENEADPTDEGWAKVNGSSDTFTVNQTITKTLMFTKKPTGSLNTAHEQVGTLTFTVGPVTAGD